MDIVKTVWLAVGAGIGVVAHAIPIWIATSNEGAGPTLGSPHVNLPTT